MLQKKLIPTPLQTEGRPKKPLEIAPVQSQRFRLVKLIWRASVLFLGLMSLRLSRRGTPQTKAQVARAQGRLVKSFLESMGGVWLKPGQILSSRRDLFPAEFCEELSSTQEQVTGFPTEIARQIIEKELRKPVEEFFSDFEDQPIAAASVGQVYRARLKKSGRLVAVKVQRPHVAENFASDMVLLHLYAGMLDRLGVMEYVRWTDTAQEVERILREEVDYRYEAHNLRNMRKHLRGSRIYIPKLFKALSTQRVLVMEFIPGVSMADYLTMIEKDPERAKAWRKENDCKHIPMGRRLFYTLRRQILEENLFHSDMHPGNIMLLRKGRICLIDFGATGTLDVNFHRKYVLFERALLVDDFTRSAEYLMLLFPPVPEETANDLKRDLATMLKNFRFRASVKGVPYVEKGSIALVTDLAKISMQYKVSAGPEFMRINRTLAALDQSLSYLIPRENVTNLVKRYWFKAERRMMRKLLFERNRHQDFDALALATEAPKQMTEMLPLLAERARDDMIRFRERATKSAHVFAALASLFTTAMIAGAFLLIMAFVDQYKKTWLHGAVVTELGWLGRFIPSLSLGYVTWGLIFLSVIYILRKLAAFRKEMLRPESRD